MRLWEVIVIIKLFLNFKQNISKNGYRSEDNKKAAILEV